MAVEFGTQAWASALMDAINANDGYQRAAKKWEGDMCFVCSAGPGVPDELVSWFDLKHGACHGAEVIENIDVKQPAFAITASLDVWKQVVDGKLDPIKGLTSRKLKLQGNLLQILKMPKAALEMVNSAKQLDTVWPA